MTTNADAPELRAAEDTYVVPPRVPKQKGIEYDWRALTRRLGQRTLQLRELLGFSQDRLAKVSGVSQGAVSRVEAGKGSATPLITYAKVFTLFARELDRTRPDAFTPEIQDFLRAVRKLAPVFWEDDAPLVSDAGLGRLMSAYAALRDSEREAFLRCVLPLAAYMRGAGGARELEVPLTEEGAFYVE
jgi:transcriptional regulator with XRE-family HTH domain